MISAIEALADRYVRTLLDDHPVFGTFLGVHDRDHELGDFSRSAQEEKNGHLKVLLTDIENLDLGDAPVEDRIDAAALRAELRRSVFEYEELRAHERQPSVYVRSILSGCHELIVGNFAPIEDRARSLLGRLSEAPGVLKSMEENIVNPPSVFALVGAETARGGAGFVSTVVPRVSEAVPSLSTELAKAGEDAAEAFVRAASHLDKLAEASTTSFRTGRERFEWLLQEYHMLELDSSELRDTGVRVLSETKERMAAVAAEIDPSRQAHEVVEELKAAHPSAGGLRECYASEMARAKAFVAEHDLVTIPRGEELDVIDTPVFLRKILPYAAYHPAGPFEAKQRGLFYVTPVDSALSPDEQERQLRGHSLHTIPIVALHEAYPGHHLQLTRTNAASRKVRKVLWNNVFIEGWALYCEEMMLEAGFYSDPRTRLGQLKEVLWRAARVVVDVGLQLGEMSVEDAIDFMVKEVALERVNATAEVKRYTANPTQPSSYLIGKLAVMSIRERYESREGSNFDLRRFHDALLDVGSIQPRLAEAALGMRPI
ncbi:MAG: DUF885 domain-containing protein [Candidatus Eisenbacteria bacterium]|nr:DUF885 domain-containing protein [Candidatus Eisenbacteria bacterium]